MMPFEPVSLPLETVLSAYCMGYFPMADTENPDLTGWVNPPVRAILPIRDIHISRSLRKAALHFPYVIRADHAFEEVIRACAKETPGRPKTWINEEIIQLFLMLHRAGYAHSIGCWTGSGDFAGGLYGLALGSAFCGESMVSLMPDASKIALIHLCARLDKAGFNLLDCQFINPHTERFGAYEIDKGQYLAQLHQAIEKPGDFSLSGSYPVDENALVMNFLKK